MKSPFIVPLDRCRDLSLVGGKAHGLARLQAAGLAVPPGCVVTTAAYRQLLETVGFSPAERWKYSNQCLGEERKRFLAECRRVILETDVSQLVEACLLELHRISGTSELRWAVRSSASNEDAAGASFAGLYRTELAVSANDIGRAIKQLWSSVWEERVVDYIVRSGSVGEPPAMAVVLQPMCEALVAGVAYSINPVTGRAHQVAINAVRGLGAPLVDGLVTPDQFVVHIGKHAEPYRVRQLVVGQQTQQLVMGSEGLRGVPVERDQVARASLTDTQLYEVARLAKRIERVFHGPVDVEWVIDRDRLWVLQARPITTASPSTDFTDDECEWSRTNFKETMPEVPSPMGLSFLEHFMDAYIVSHYRRLGCRIPPGVSSVRTRHGRPYLNVTLFHSLIGQLRGEPSLNVEQMGGEPLDNPPDVIPLGWKAYLRAGWVMWKEMKRVERLGPRFFREMKQLRATYSRARVAGMPSEKLRANLNDLGRWLDQREVTFGIAAGVGQCLQMLSLLLPNWLGEDWRTLLNAALQGQGNVISAQQIVRLSELVEVARADATVVRQLPCAIAGPGSYRRLLQGTAFLASFDRYMEDYGHRAVGESDVMSLRFSDEPEKLLAVIAAQLDGPSSTPDDIVERQRVSREKALATMKARFGWRIERWLVFRWWYRRLSRFFALREANRHHLMFYSAAVRNLLLALGDQFVQRGIFDIKEDIFFLTWQERETLTSEVQQDWKPLIQARRAQWNHWARQRVPDTIREWGEAVGPDSGRPRGDFGEPLHGIPISPGLVTGPARFIRSVEEWSKVRRGDIILASVIDPGMAPLFGLAAGLVVEMGGTLSHGAIICREYGLPAVTNVSGVTTAVVEGEQIELDAYKGLVKRHVPIAPGQLQTNQ